MKHQGVFIGLGGAGVCASAHLKARLLKEAGSREKLSEHCRFVFIDTDTSAYNKMNALYSKDFASQNLIDDDWVPFSSVSPLYLYRQAVGKRDINNLDDEMEVLLSFVDERSASSFKSVRLEEGASANRQQGRVAIWSQWRAAQRKINACIEGLKNPKNAEQSTLSIPFYILSGTCGGTGSSMFLDVAYLVDRTVKSHFKGREPTVRAVLFMPEWYIQLYKKDSNEDIVRKYQSNAYAFFEELNYFLADYHAGEDMARGRGFEKVFVAPAIEEQVESYNKKWSVFNFAICVDSTSELEAKFDDDQMYRNTAEMIYHWHRAEVQSPVVSSFDNQLRDNYLAKTRVPAFVTMGYRALQYPAKLISEYLTARFLYEFFKDGLLIEGEGAREYLKTTVGSQWLQGVVDNALKPHLFARLESGAKKVLNNARHAINQGVGGFQYPAEGLSMGQQIGKGLRRIVKRSTNTSYDFAKVGNANTLDQFRSDAEREIAGLDSRLADMFSRSHGDSSQSELSGKCKNAIEWVLENAFLAFGFSGARLVAAELESILNDLNAKCLSEETQTGSALRDLDSSISSARQDCLNKRDDNSLVQLRALLERKLDLTYLVALVRQRSQLLGAIAGNEGALNRYQRSLISMNRHAQDWLSRSETDENGKSIKHTFEDVLRSSSLTENTVTTTYLPSVKNLLDGGRPNPSHPFSQTYAELVPQNSKQTAPLRRCSSGDIWKDPQGMHRTIAETLGNANAGSNNPVDDVPDSLFLRYLRSPAEHFQMPRDFEDSARQMISHLIEEKDVAHGNVDKAFSDLSYTEKEKMKAEFVNGTGTFCQMDSSLRSKPLDVRLYVGQSVDLASSLGYRDGSESRFVQSLENDGLLYVTAKALWTIDEYPFYEQYRRIYHAQRQTSLNGNGVLFSPHIHQLFNELGVQAGMRRLLHPGVNSEIFALTLLYKELFRIAKESFFPLFREIVYWDEELQGNLATRISPIENDSDNGTQQLRVAEKIGFRDGKLLFEEENFGIVVQPYRNLKQLFDKLEEEHPRVFAELQKVDESFRQNCSREWASDDGPLVQAFDVMDNALTVRSSAKPIAEEIINWHAGMKNRLRDVYRELRSDIFKSQKVTRPYKGSPDEDYEPQLIL